MARYNLAHRLTRGQDRLFDRLRDPRASEAARGSGTAATFDALNRAEYALVVTFRRSGEPVATPMWFGLHDGRMHVRSLADAGKVKRLRHDPRVRVAPCSMRGKPTGPFTDGVGRILGLEESKTADAARREVHRAPGGKRIETVVEVVEYEPDRVFGMRIIEGLPVPIMSAVLKRQFEKHCTDLKAALEGSASR